MRRINRYISSKFLLIFLQVCLGFSAIIFFINFLEIFEQAGESNASLLTIAVMSFLKLPEFLNDVSMSLILTSSLITFFLLSLKSEITVIRSSGFSLWHILKPVIISSFVVGVFWVMVFGPISIVMARKFHHLQNKYINHEVRDSLSPEQGIWLKQTDENSDEEVIIQAKKVYKESLELSDVSFWFFDKNGKFYQKFDAKKAYFKEGQWVLHDVIKNDAESLNERLQTASVPTNLKAEFIIQKVLNNFQNPKLFSVFQLPKLIREMEDSGLGSIKFRVYFQYLITLPLTFISMSIIGCYFGMNHVRDKNSMLMLFLGIALGLVLYIFSGIMLALGSSGLLPNISATWIITFIFFAIGVLLIYKKENL